MSRFFVRMNATEDYSFMKTPTQDPPTLKLANGVEIINRGASDNPNITMHVNDTLMWGFPPTIKGQPLV